MLHNAQLNYDFFETPKYHGQIIYDNYNPKSQLKVLDICCGLGSLIDPWYDNGHSVTLIELNDEFIPILEKKYPKATIIKGDFLLFNYSDDYDVYLCNPSFNTKNVKKIYKYFFCKILRQMKYPSVLYFICPKMFYKDQMHIKIEIQITDTYGLIQYIKDNKSYPASYYFEKYNMIELHSNGFVFERTIIDRMVIENIINDGFIDEDNCIVPYFEFRFLGNIFDFKETACKCGLFKVSI